MNWKRYQILIVTAALCLVVSTVFVFWMMKSNARNAELEMEIQNLDSEQNRLTSQKIYPSQANLVALKKAQDEVVQRRDRFAALISQGQLAAPSMMRAQFGDHVKRMVDQLRSAAAGAKKGGEQGVILSDPQFALASYLEGGLPEAGEIPGLMVRLELVRHLTTLLYESGISELVSIEAEKPVAAPTAAENPAVVPGFGIPRPAAPAFGAFPGASVPAATAQPPELLQKERLFESVKCTLHVRVYEDHLWDLINRLVADPNQVVIRSVEIANTNESLWPPFLRPGRAMDRRQVAQAPTRPANRIEALLAMTEALTPVSAETGTPIPGLASRRQLTTGGELISVVIDLTVYRLKAPITPAT